jgi:hypothetical protein
VIRIGAVRALRAGVHVACTCRVCATHCHSTEAMQSWVYKTGACASVLGTRRRRCAVASCGLRACSSAPPPPVLVYPVLYPHAPTCCCNGNGELGASRGAPTCSCATD